MKSFKRFLEDFNIYPKSKYIYGRPAPTPGPNINFSGPLPSGFKGSGIPGIAPGSEGFVAIKIPKNKKKKKTKKASKD